MLIAVGAGVYFYTQGKDMGAVVDGAVETTTDAATEAAAAAETAAAEAAAATEAAAAEAAAAEAAAATEAAAAEATEAAAAAATVAAEAAAATEAAAAEAAAATEAAAAETAAATEAATTEAAAAEPETSMMDTLLSADDFDAAKVSEMVDGSDLGLAKKTMLKAAIEKAGDNPEMIKAVIDQIKGAMGL